MPGDDQTTPQETTIPEAYFDPDSAAVIRGVIVPGTNLIRAAVEKLRADVQDDAALKARWQSDPHAVLSERGFYADLQTNVLNNSGIATPESFCLITTVNSGCCAASVVA